MTTANKVTIARILFVPLFVAQIISYVNSGNEWHRLAAIVCFALAALGDALDGYIARRYHQQSELGAILDPLADKLLLVSALVILSLDTRQEVGANSLVAGRDRGDAGVDPAVRHGGDPLRLGQIHGPAASSRQGGHCAANGGWCFGLCCNVRRQRCLILPPGPGFSPSYRACSIYKTSRGNGGAGTRG